MLPTLENFSISPPVYIRKIRSKASWTPDNEIDNPEEAIKEIAKASFDDISSIWLVNSEQDFYSIIASLSSRRNPRDQNIDFIWLTENELNSLGIPKYKTMEGECLFSQNLHYNIEVKKDLAIQLCNILKQKNREAIRCKKKQHTRAILAYREEIGCKALDSSQEFCQCELGNFI